MIIQWLYKTYNSKHRVYDTLSQSSIMFSFLWTVEFTKLNNIHFTICCDSHFKSRISALWWRKI